LQFASAFANVSPIEKRKVWSPTSNHAQGELEMIVDIMPSEKAQYTIPLQIEKLCPQPQPFELRMIAWTVKEIDFRGDFYKNIVNDRPTDHLNLPTTASGLRKAYKDFYVRATFKAADENRAPNYLWKTTQFSDTSYNVRADSDDGFQEGQVVRAIHPMHGSSDAEECKISRRYGTIGEDIDRYDVTFKDGYVATYVGPNGEARAGKQMRIKAAAAQHVKKGMCVVHWRFCWKMQLPCSDPYIHIALRDRNDTEKWCERTLDLFDMFRHALNCKRIVGIEEALVESPDPKRYVSGQGNVKRKAHQSNQYESTGCCGPNAVQVNMKNKNHPNTVAKMWCSLEVLPEADSHKMKAGLGRTAPNNLCVGLIAM